MPRVPDYLMPELFLRIATSSCYASKAWQASGQATYTVMDPTTAVTRKIRSQANSIRVSDVDGTSGDSWRSAPLREPQSDDPSLPQKRHFVHAAGTAGRRAAGRVGFFYEIASSGRANRDPTEMATTAGLRGALGVGEMGEAAAKAVISRMMRKRKQRQRDKEIMRQGSGSIDFAKKIKQSHHPTATGARQGVRSRRGSKGLGSTKARDMGMFGAVLSSMAKKRLREGLAEITTNPPDLLRCGLVEMEPTGQGSTALGCHLMKGWAEQKLGNERRVSVYLAIPIIALP